MLRFLILFAFSSALALPPQHGTVMEERKFDAGGYPCVFRVIASRHSKYDEPKEVAAIECSGRIVFAHDLRDADVTNIVFREGYEGRDFQHERIAINWERGTGSGITVFEVARFDLSRVGSGPTAKVIFEHYSKCGGEVFEYGDVMLANVGMRMVGSLILPAGTNAYRWKDGRYEFADGFHWNKDASNTDRYCILIKPAGCPAIIEDKPIPDSF